MLLSRYFLILVVLEEEKTIDYLEHVLWFWICVAIYFSDLLHLFVSGSFNIPPSRVLLQYKKETDYQNNHKQSYFLLCLFAKLLT